MSIRTTVLSIVIALLFGSVAARAESPQIFFISPGNEAFPLMLLGSGLDPAGTNEFIYWCPEPLMDFARGTDWHNGPHADAIKEADALFLSYMGCNPALPLEVPAKSEKYPNNPARRKAEPVAERGFAGAHRTAYETGSDLPTGNAARMAWLKTKDGLSRPYLHNTPQAWWLDLDEARVGQRVRLYGMNLTKNIYPPVRLIYLRSRKDGKLYKAVWGSPTNIGNIYSGDLTWEARFEVPDCPPGDYEVFLHKGDAAGFGWTRGLSLKVAPKDAAPDRRLDAREAGAVGDGKSDDYKALDKAVNKLAEQGGGVLYLPAGDYLLKKTLTVPAGVCLRGASRGGTILLTRAGKVPALRMLSRTRLEDMTVRQGKTGAAALVELGDGSDPVRDVRLSGVSFEAGVGQLDARRPGQWQSLVVVSPAEGLEITNCDLGERRFITVLRGLERSRITYNTGGIYLEGYMRRCVVEYNESRGGGGFIFRATQGDIANNYLQWNRVVDAPDTVLGGGYLFESTSDEALQGRVASAEGRALVLEGQKGRTAGTSVVVVSGRGRGQVLGIASLSGAQATLAEDWILAPVAGDRVYLGPLIYRNIIVNNFHVRSGNAVTLRGASADNFLARLALAQTDGIRLIGVEKEGRVYPCYRNTLAEMNIFGGGSVGFAAETESGRPDGVLLMGNSIGFQSRVYRVGPVREKPAAAGAFWLSALGKAPAGDAVLGECNLINARVVTPGLPAGTAVGAGFVDNFISCIYDNTAAGLDDKGRGTKISK